jgi:hypothetical protein
MSPAPPVFGCVVRYVVILVVCIEGSCGWIFGIVLEPADQKIRAFLVLITLS